MAGSIADASVWKVNEVCFICTVYQLLSQVFFNILSESNRAAEEQLSHCRGHKERTPETKL